MKLKYCNIIIAAYKAERWILDCLESVRRQRTVIGWEYRTLIGVDGCETTSKLLSRRGYTHYFSQENVGPYIMRNSLFQLKSAEVYAVFDADDMMTDSYIQVLLKRVGNGIAGSGRTTIDENGQRVQGRTRYRCGVCMISANAMRKLGGYADFRVAADHDLIERARLLNIPIVRVDSPLYIRRKVAESLTQSKSTGMKSKFRHEQVREAKELRQAGLLCYDPPVCTPLILKEGYYK